MRSLYKTCLLLVVVLMSAFAKASDTLTPISLQLKWQHQFQFAGYYAAIAKGFYQEAGLKVNLIPAQSGVDPVSQVLNGKADFGVGTTELLMRREKGDPVVVLAVIFQYSPLALIAKREQAIQTLHDLTRKPIAIEPGSSEIIAYLKHEGIDVDTINTSQHDLYIEKLMQGDISAQTAYITSEPFLMQERGVDYQLFSPQSVGIDFYGDNLFTTQQQINEHPERVKAFKAASLKGWVYAMAHTEEIIQLILQQYNPTLNAEALRFEAQKMSQLMQTEMIQPGHMTEGRWRHIVQVYSQAGMLSPNFKLDGFYYDDKENSINLRPYYTLIGVLVLISLIITAVLLYIYRIKMRLAASEKNYRQLIELAPLAFIVIQKDGIISEWNQAASQLFGWQANEAIGQNILKLIVNESLHADINQLFQLAINQNKSIDNVNENITRDGKSIQCQWHNTPRYDINNQVRSIICLAQDITQRQQLEQSLKQAKEQAEQTLLDHRQFLSMVSHEFRTPLASILQSFQLMQLYINRNMTIPINVVDRVGRAAMRMIEFMDKLYVMDRFDSACWQLNLSNVQLEPVIESILEEHQALFPNRSIVRKINTLPNPNVCWDIDLIRVALNNLLSNALKYSPEQSNVMVDIFSDAQSVTITIRDYGQGIEPELLPFVFDKFVRSDQVGRIAGTGMGLYIVRRIIQLHGGRVQLSNHSEGGLLAVVILPIDVTLSNL